GDSAASYWHMVDLVWLVLFPRLCVLPWGVKMNTHALEIGLAGLVLLPLAAWLTGHNVSASWVIGCVLAATFIKGQWLIDELMELRHAPAWLRCVVGGWLVLIVGMTALFNM